MSFRVVLTRKAAREVSEHYDWLAKRSRAGADRWRESLREAIESLQENAERCPEAPEAEYLEGLRQLLHGRRRQVHRILFEIRCDTVVILRVRHAAQDWVAPEDL
jgi:plasmid stabilization system protein ParE